MKARHQLLAVWLTVLLAACGSSGSKKSAGFDPYTPDLSVIQAPDSLKQFILSHWSGVARVCPGLDFYRDDLAIDGINSHFDRRVDLILRVDGKPTSIPTEFHATGHSCYFSITGDGDSVIIPKDPCASICLAEKQSSSRLALPLR